MTSDVSLVQSNSVPVGEVTDAKRPQAPKNRACLLGDIMFRGSPG